MNNEGMSYDFVVSKLSDLRRTAERQKMVDLAALVARSANGEIARDD
jgi:hypothetical protein